MQKRAHVYYTGRVQGVGFRFTAVGVAGRYDVSGSVRNLRDGRVELVAEGEEGEIAALLEELSRAMKGFIRHEEVRWEHPAEEFEDFSIGY